MSNEPKKPIEAEELTEKELEDVSGGGKGPNVSYEIGFAVALGTMMPSLPS